MTRFCLLAVMSILAAGCSDRGDRSHLAETSWRFVTIDGEQPQSETAGMNFSNGNIGVQVGCNHLGGPWRVDENRLVAGPLAQTEMGCSAPSWDEERAVGALLVAIPKMNLKGDRMTLQSRGHRAELVKVERQAPAQRGG